MTADITITSTDLELEVKGFDKVWSFKSHLTIPLEHVRGATHDPGIVVESKGWRVPGTHLPGVITAGTFHQDGGRVFWDVRHPANAVVIELADEQYTRLVVEVDDPPATVAAIEAAIHPSA